MSCPNCPCAFCVASRTAVPGGLPWKGAMVSTPTNEMECAFARMAADYAARGEQMPSMLMLYCGCKKCSPVCM